MSVYKSLVRPLLFRMSADRSHKLAQRALRSPIVGRLLATPVPSDRRLQTCFAGVNLPNPIGLAAGFDKNCDMLESLSCLGFGFITPGSLMPQARYGNPFPRLVRYPDTESLADSMGVPSKGIAYAFERLGRSVKFCQVPIFANIGGFSAAAIADSFCTVAPHVSGVEISLMCPNAQDMRRADFDEIRMMSDILARLEGHATPIIIRVPNETTRSDTRFDEMIERCIAAGVKGLKIGGGRPVEEPGLGTGRGTLHGRAVFKSGLSNVTRASRIARGRISIKGNGGVSSAADVVAMLQAGACCVDLYSAFIYQGWAVARTIASDLLDDPAFTMERYRGAPIPNGARQAA